MEKKKYSLYSAGGDVSKQWYVWIKDAYGNRQRWCGDINKNKPSAEEKYRRANELIKQLESSSLDIIESKNRAETLSYLFIALENNKHTLREKSYSTYSSKLNIMAGYLDSQNKRHFDAELANKFIQSLHMNKRSATTIGAYIIFANRVYGLAKKKSPFVAIKRPKKKPVPAKYFTQYQKSMIFKAVKEHEVLKRCVQLLYYCFIRPGEQRNLRVGDVSLQSGRILIPSMVSKNSKSLHVVIPTCFYEELEAWNLQQYPDDFYLLGVEGVPSDKKVSKNFLSNKHLDVLSSLKFNTATYKLYSWKHTGAVDFIKNGGSVKELQLQMRHRSLDQTDQYLRQLGIMDMEGIADRFKKL